MEDVRASVIVPVYNVEKYLRTCLDSVLRQDLDGMEIICVDDGSTDSSPRILREYAARDERIQILRQPNGGLSVARNTGIDVARGKYLLFLDSDDSLAAPDVLRSLCERAEADDLDMLFFGAQMLYESEELRAIASEAPDFYLRRGDYPACETGQALYLRMEARREYHPNAYLYLLRREFLARAGLRFPPGIYHEDEFFTLAAMGLAERASCVPLQGYVRLWREGSIMSEQSQARRIRGNLLAARALLEFARERLAGADGKFLRRYRAHALAINLRGYGKYERLTEAQRRSFLEGLAEGDRDEVQEQLRLGKRSARKREVKRFVRRLIPENIRAAIKRMR